MTRGTGQARDDEEKLARAAPDRARLRSDLRGRLRLAVIADRADERRRARGRDRNPHRLFAIGANGTVKHVQYLRLPAPVSVR
jgi:hypothetical protein